MRAKCKCLNHVTAEDLMTREVTVIPQTMPVRDAVRLLFEKQITGAPVVDAYGRCVGAISVTDFARMGLRHGVDVLVAAPRPVTCSFQEAGVGPDGRERVICTLPPESCPYQRRQHAEDGRPIEVCTEPHIVCVDWQVVEMEKLPSEEVRHHMTADPVVASPDTPARTLAQMMVDAQIHRVFVVDAARRPIGIVASTDLLAALAGADDEEHLLTKRPAHADFPQETSGVA